MHGDCGGNGGVEHREYRWAGVGDSGVFVGCDSSVGGGCGESYFVPDLVEPVVDDLLVLSGRRGHTSSLILMAAAHRIPHIYPFHPSLAFWSFSPVSLWAYRRLSPPGTL